MTRRRDIEKRLYSLEDIDKILGSMRNLAYLETRKLSQFMSTERRMVKCIEDAAADLLYYYPGLLRASEQASQIFIVIGSERGFCGDFNELLLNSLEERRDSGHARQHMIITVGQKLSLAMEDDKCVVETLDGPSVAEEIHDILLRLVSTINDIEEQRGPLILDVIYHDADVEAVRDVSVLPPFQSVSETAHSGYPPRLNLSPERCIEGLVEHYLLAVLYQVFYSSLMAEQQQRIHHLEGAMKQLEEKMSDLELKRNALRQEEIVEEIEVILLGATDRPGR